MEQATKTDGYIVVSRKILADNDLTFFERILLIYIGSYGEFFESTKKTAAFFGVSERVVANAKRKLVQMRRIIETKNTGRGKRYIINSKYLWKTTPKTVQKYVEK